MRTDPPRPPERSLQWCFERFGDYIVPPTYVLEIPEGRVFGEGIIITPENQILSDVSLDFRAPAGRHRLCQRATLPRPKHVPGRLAVLASAEGNTYFHWLFDVVPRLNILADIPFDHLLVESNRSFQKDWLAMLDIQASSVIPAVKHGHLKPDVLVVPSLPDSTVHVTHQSCTFLRQVADRCALLSPSPPRRRIYVSRSDAERRGVRNSDEVWRILNARGFERIEPGRLSPADQIRVFSEAEFVIGPHGAGLSNLVFCPPQTSVLELFSPTYVNPCFWLLAKSVGLRYAYLLGLGELPRPHTEPTSIGEDMDIDPLALRRALDVLGV